MGATVVGMCFFALFPRYTCRDVDGVPTFRIDRWTARIVSSYRPVPVATAATDVRQENDPSTAATRDVDSRPSGTPPEITRFETRASDVEVAAGAPRDPRHGTA